jgi:hypothetical protein
MIRFFSLFLLCGIVTLSEVEGFSQAKPGDTLHWKEGKPLSWADFKGKSKNGMAGEAFCTIDAKYEKPNPLKKTKFKIFAVWDRSKSWIAAASKNEDELLYYQVLFNMYEVHARQLRKEFSETKWGMDPEKVFRAKYNEADASLTDDVRNFRDETDEGANMEELKKRDEKIKKALKDLLQFQE